MNSYQITFHLDGSGVYFDPAEPIHIDALVAWVLAPMQGIRHVDRSMPPYDVRLPIKQSEFCGRRVHHASALLPEGPRGESVWYWRKRFRQSRCEISTGAPNTQMGTYRDWQMPLPLLLCRRMVGYAVGHRKDLRKALKQIRYLGKKRAHGHGRVTGLEIDPTDQDQSLFLDGRSNRFLPHPEASRMVRIRPPYWHPHDAVPCAEIGTPESAWENLPEKA